MLERMLAVVQQAFGGPEVLEVAEVDRPVPLGTEVLVRVQAVGVNPVEPLIRSGQFPLIGPPPFILGWDISGMIEDLEGVTRFDVGDEVYGMPFLSPRGQRLRAIRDGTVPPARRKPPSLSTPRPPRCRWQAWPPGRVRPHHRQDRADYLARSASARKTARPRCPPPRSARCPTLLRPAALQNALICAGCRIQHRADIGIPNGGDARTVGLNDGHGVSADHGRGQRAGG
jgi:hypothetical protein